MPDATRGLFGSCFFAGIKRSKSTHAAEPKLAGSQIIDRQPARAQPMPTPGSSSCAPPVSRPRRSNAVASSSRLAHTPHAPSTPSFSPNLLSRPLSPIQRRAPAYAPTPEPIPLPSPVKLPPPAHTKTQYHKIGHTRVAIRVEGPAYALARPLPPRTAAMSRHKETQTSMPERREKLRKGRRHEVGESWLDLR
ncbi:hypothetical protein PENSPDRAFT_652102 [Peniophora sp. CONT]|nr:hypothetical protein PENSPDRAFT_652102 [Peniophora sp. CONT]